MGVQVHTHLCDALTIGAYDYWTLYVYSASLYADCIFSISFRKIFLYLSRGCTRRFGQVRNECCGCNKPKKHFTFSLPTFLAEMALKNNECFIPVNYKFRRKAAASIEFGNIMLSCFRSYFWNIIVARSYNL